MIRGLVTRSLETLGHTQIDQARDGIEALNKLHDAFETHQAYDLVFLDWNMPHMTGLETLQSIKNDKHLKDTPVVMISVERGESQVAGALKAGAADYIAKPFSSNEIKTKISRILQQRKAA
jgi:CheY-like chemotaxis protein